MIGSQELILILVIILIVIGPEKLPEVAKKIGNAIQELNRASANFVDYATSSSDEEEERKTIIKIAKNLGIDTEKKSTKQLVEEIEGKTVKNKESSKL